MRIKLFFSALTKALTGFVLMAALLLLPAGTLAYSGAWRLLALLFAPMTALGAVLLWKRPDLLAKRLASKEARGEQRGVVAASGVMFVLGFILAGLDFRFGWSALPPWLVHAASVLFVIAYALYAEVMRENAWLSRTVEVQAGQQVVSTGLYAIVRHPMYTATIALFLSMPLVLGSWVAFAAFLIYPAAIVRRIRDEEELLTAELAGYAAYKKTVKYRLIPFVW